MKASNSTHRFTVTVATLALLLAAGCNKKTDSGLPSGGERLVSAERTSFDAVAKHLDPGGNLYVYVSTEKWLANLSESVSGLQSLVAAAPAMQGENASNLEKGFGILTRLINDSGLEDISGAGLSSIAREPGMYYSKAFVHHYPDKDDGFLWNLIGGKAHPLNGLDLLPTNTVVAAFADLDVPLLWSVVQKQVAQSGFIQAGQFLEKLPALFEERTGLSMETLMQSLGGEFGCVVTFDESNRIPIPLPNGAGLELPEPAVMLVLKVNDEALFQHLDELLKVLPVQPVNLDRAGLKMRTFALPIPIPLKLQPTVASGSGYLVFGSNPGIVNQAFDVKAGAKGLKSTTEFKQLTRGVPDTGNQFYYVSQRLAETIRDVQQQALKSAPPAISRYFANANTSPNYFYAVAGNTGDGWLVTANGTGDGSQVLMASTMVVPAGMLAAIAIPNFVKAKQAAERNTCRNNLRQLNRAKAMFYLEHPNHSSAPTQEELLPHLGQAAFPTCPGGGTYLINAANQPASCSLPAHALQD